jgi:hypothetical protein
MRQGLSQQRQALFVRRGKQEGPDYFFAAAPGGFEFGNSQ